MVGKYRCVDDTLDYSFLSTPDRYACCNINVSNTRTAIGVTRSKNFLPNIVTQVYQVRSTHDKLIKYDECIHIIGYAS